MNTQLFSFLILPSADRVGKGRASNKLTSRVRLCVTSGQSVPWSKLSKESTKQQQASSVVEIKKKKKKKKAHKERGGAFFWFIF